MIKEILDKMEKLITKKGIILGVACGIGAGTLGAFFGGLKIMMGVIMGIASAIFAILLISKVDSSDNFPYWKKNEK